jgi:hypothetical protein
MLHAGRAERLSVSFESTPLAAMILAAGLMRWITLWWLRRP